MSRLSPAPGYEDRGGDGETLPMVSVILPTLNGDHLLEESLPSLVGQTYEPLEILVVDNASHDDSEAVVSRFDVRWISLDHNYGFGPAINLGVAAARGDILVFVNNDMRFDPMFVERLVEPIIRDEGVFATDACQFSWNGEDQLHGASRLIKRTARDLIRRGGMLPLLDIELSFVTEDSTTFQACGGNMAVDRSKFEELGGLDDRLVAGWEDTDIAWRAWSRDWATVYVPAAVCWHRVGVTSDSEEGARVRLRGSLGGRLLFATKYLPLEHVAATWAHAFAGLLGSIMRGGWTATRPRATIIVEFAKLIPALLRERSAFYRLAGSSPRHYLDRMRLIGPSNFPSDQRA